MVRTPAVSGRRQACVGLAEPVVSVRQMVVSQGTPARLKQRIFSSRRVSGGANHRKYSFYTSEQHRVFFLVLRQCLKTVGTVTL